MCVQVGAWLIVHALYIDRVLYMYIAIGSMYTARDHILHNEALQVHTACVCSKFWEKSNCGFLMEVYSAGRGPWGQGVVGNLVIKDPSISPSLMLC